MTWVGNVACMRDRRGAYRVLVWKPVGRTSRHRWRNILNSRTWGQGLD